MFYIKYHMNIKNNYHVLYINMLPEAVMTFMFQVVPQLYIKTEC
jgi:hypothetical protein